MDLKAHIGGRVKKARLASGMTQEALAEVLGKSGRTVSAIESGESLTTLTTLEEISRKLREPISYFFDGYEGARSRSYNRTANAIENILATLARDELDLALTLLRALKQHSAEQKTALRLRPTKSHPAQTDP